MVDVIASPSVRKRALEMGIDIEKHAVDLGRESITMDDLAGAQAASAPASAGSSSYWDVDHSQYGPVTEAPMSRFAQLAARNLAAAQALIPAVTHHDRADVTEIEAFRKRLKPEAEARGLKLTALAFQVKAVSKALREFPRFNASLSPDGETLILKDYVHIGIAVDTEYGLMVPVIRNADRKGLCQISSEITDLAARAQARKVRADEMGGASMTISNLGGIGGTGFTPIVNPPEVAILGITRTEIVTVWNEDTPKPLSMVPMDLSYDHRVLNGADAARFMSRLCRLMADPRHLML